MPDLCPEDEVRHICINKWTYEVHQLDYRSVCFGRNGMLDPYEDWRLPALKRAEDLASRLSVDEIAGLMLYSSHQPSLPVLTFMEAPPTQASRSMRAEHSHTN